MKLNRAFLWVGVFWSLTAFGGFPESTGASSWWGPEPSSNFKQMLEEQMRVIGQALQEEDASQAPLGEASEVLYLQNFWVRTRLPVGFAIPGLVQFQVVPEVEFLVRRLPPEGWEPYHP